MSEATRSDSDVDYRKAFASIYSILSNLLVSASLDPSTEAKDCLAVFDEYEWIMKPSCERVRFELLVERGNSGTLSLDELDEFMNLVSDEGDLHHYYFIFHGKHAIYDYRELFKMSRLIVAADT